MRSFSIFFRIKPGSSSNGLAEFLQSSQVFLQSPLSLQACLSPEPGLLLPPRSGAAMCSPPTWRLSRDPPVVGTKLAVTSTTSPAVPVLPRTVVILLAALFI